jgi:hypothetical protein
MPQTDEEFRRGKAGVQLSCTPQGRVNDELKSWTKDTLLLSAREGHTPHGANVAISAEHPETRWEPILLEPGVHFPAAANLFSMPMTAAIHMIDLQTGDLGLTAADTNRTTIGIQDFEFEIRMVLPASVNTALTLLVADLNRMIATGPAKASSGPPVAQLLHYYQHFLMTLLTSGLVMPSLPLPTLTAPTSGNPGLPTPGRTGCTTLVALRTIPMTIRDLVGTARVAADTTLRVTIGLALAILLITLDTSRTPCLPENGKGPAMDAEPLITSRLPKCLFCLRSSHRMPSLVVRFPTTSIGHTGGPVTQNPRETSLLCAQYFLPLSRKRRTPACTPPS